MTTATPRPTDFTGRQRQKQLKEHASELAARADEIALQSAEETERLANEVVDVTPTIIDEVQDVGVSTADNSVVMRVNTDIEQMTFGKGNTYDFKVGVKYKVHLDLFNYLDSLGYVWH